MSRITPAIGASGIYVVTTPYTIRPATTYTCKAIRSFDDIYRLNEDVFALYYEPYGLTLVEFNNDVAAGAVIVTLMANEIGLEVNPSDPKTIIYIPDTYISSFPNGDAIPYSHIVLSASLGALPDYLDVSDTMSDIGNIISEKIGVTPEVNIHKAPMSNVMTSSAHNAAEIARQAAVTNRNTIYTQYYELNNLYNSLLGRYNDLEASYIHLDNTSSDNNEYLAKIGYFTIDLLNNTVNDVIYVDAKFFNQVKIVMDLTAFPINSYIDIDSVNPLNGTTGSIDVNGDLIFDIDQYNLTGNNALFTIKVYDDNDVEVDSFTIDLIYVSEYTDRLFGNLTLDFDLTLSAPHTQRLYFGNFTRTQRVLLDEPVINDVYDEDELYYELANSVPGVDFVYGKNFIELTVDESLFLGSVDTTVDIDFIRRTGIAPSITDFPGTITLHITNSP